MLPLIPYPRKLHEKNGMYTLPEQLGTELNGFAPWCIAAYSARTGRSSGGATWLRLNRNKDLSSEGYQLHVDADGITVQAANEQGAVWALTTLAELEKDGVIPCCKIEDEPQYSHRGISLDCSRHFFAVQEVKKVIEEISLAKMNVLHWHLSDDQGWRIESRRFPRLHTQSGAYYTQAEIAEVVEFAHLRGVEIVPEIDLPGHTSGILAACPEYSCSEKKVGLASSGGIYPVIFCAGKENTYVFLEELLDEIIPLFPGPRFHIGGDEAPKSEWKKCPHCRRRKEMLGITEYEDLQGYFTGRVSDYLKKHGKQAVCWNETIQANNAPEDIQIQYWTLQHREPMESFVKRGGRWIYSDMFELYLDYPYSMTPLKKVYTMKPHLGKTDVGELPHLLGMEGCLWTEHVLDAERLENLLFPRAYALAERCWTGERDYKEFLERLETVVTGKLHQEICYTARNWWDPEGAARRQEALGYLAEMNAGLSDEVREQTVETAAPNREFAKSFMSKFFKPQDIPFLLKSMKK